MDLDELNQHTSTIFNARSEAKETLENLENTLAKNKEIKLNLELELNTQKILNARLKSKIGENSNLKTMIEQKSSDVITKTKDIYKNCRKIFKDCENAKIEYSKFEFLFSEITPKIQSQLSDNNSELEKEIEALQRHYDDQAEYYRLEIAILEKEVEGLEIDAAKLDPDNLLSKIERLKNQSALRIQENVEINDEILDIQNELSFYDEAPIFKKIEEVKCQQISLVENFNNEKELLDKRVKYLENEILLSSKSLEEQEIILKDLNEKIDVLENKITNNKTLLNDYNHKIDDMENDMRSAAEDYGNKVSLNNVAIEELEAKIKEEDEKVKILQMELEKIKENNNLKNDIKEDKLAIESLRQEKQQRMKNIENLTSDCLQLEEQIEEATFKSSEYSKGKIEMEEKYNESKKQNEEKLREKTKIAQEKLEGDMKEYSDKKNEHEQVKITNSKLSEEIRGIQLAIEEEQKRLEEIRSRKENLAKEEADLDKKLKETKTVIYNKQKVIREKKKSTKTKPQNKDVPKSVKRNFSSDESSF
ncbi:unnamed protein product [Brassicogethes aeneus]|uniref:Uncharacterized protein n=1 Tax=Brassicogethes aeneus TaxID=1431903 RepID=A0A9P0ARA2_BRAAE|nr:unnamed protein product [Brassicogethes aeneus]